MAEGQQDGSEFSFSATGAGAYAVTRGTSRTENLYALYENDLEALSLYDNGSALFFGAGGILLGTALSTLIGWMIQRAAPDAALAHQAPNPLAFLYIVLAAIFGAFAIGAYALGIILRRKRGTLLTKIKSVSMPISPNTVSGRQGS